MKRSLPRDYKRPMGWFRLYSEFADDPKVQTMSEELQRRLVMLFCLRCKCEQLQDTDLAFYMRISEAQLVETKAVFLKKGFIDERWDLLNWNRRQCPSDSSTERVRRHRLKHEKTPDETHETNAKPIAAQPPERNPQQRRGLKQGETSRKRQIQREREKQTQIPEAEKTKTFAPSADAFEASTPVVITFPLVDKTEAAFTEADVADWSKAFPAVDVMQHLLRMREWLKANPKKLKTRSGVRAFVTNWLGKEQDTPRGGRHGSTDKSDRVLDRSRQNLTNISSALRRADGTGSGFFSEPDNPSDDSGRVAQGVGSDRGAIRRGEVSRGVVELAHGIQILSVAGGDRGGV